MILLNVLELPLSSSRSPQLILTIDQEKEKKALLFGCDWNRLHPHTALNPLQHIFLQLPLLSLGLTSFCVAGRVFADRLNSDDSSMVSSESMQPEKVFLNF